MSKLPWKVPLDALGVTGKLKYVEEAIKTNGGVLESLKIAMRTDELKQGEHVGTDKYGNKYYYNPRYFFGRSRWVIYSEKTGFDYNASQVPAEWHNWLHYITDKTPIENPPAQRKWIQDHRSNYTGMKDAYAPYSTTKPKIEAWKPPTK